MDFARLLMSPASGGWSLLVVAGEASGDMHAASLCARIRSRLDGPVEFWGAGGEALQDMGARLLALSHHLGAIGPAAAVGQLYRYWTLYRRILRQVSARRPDGAILVDFPDFNLLLARALRRRGVRPLVYFISPQVWAWRRGRVRSIRRDIDRMIVLLPFEADFYRGQGVRADYYGHPLAAAAPPPADPGAFRRRHGIDPGGVLVAVLPGSRRREVEMILPLVLRGAGRMPEAERRELRLIVCAAPGMAALVEGLCRKAAADGLSVTVLAGGGEALYHCRYGVIKSGTSTLEAALAGLPFCAVYRVSFWTWLMVKLLVRTEHYALPNLVLGERVVPELMQWAAHPRSLAAVLSSFVRADKKWETVRSRLGGVRRRLAASDPYGDAAAAVVSALDRDRLRTPCGGAGTG